MKRNKYNAIKTMYNGVLYDSRKESRRAAEFDLLRRAEDPKERVIFVARQVPFKFAYGGKYFADFLVCYASGPEGIPTWKLYDVKGGNATKTQAYRIKRKLLKLEYGIDLEEI